MAYRQVATGRDVGKPGSRVFTAGHMHSSWHLVINIPLTHVFYVFSMWTKVLHQAGLVRGLPA